MEILLPAVFLFIFFGVAARMYGWFGIRLAGSAFVLSPLFYFLLGIQLPGCPRFHSFPFGGCSYQDQIILLNLGFWMVVIYAAGCLLRWKTQARRGVTVVTTAKTPWY